MINPLTKEQAFKLVDAISKNETLALSASAFENENGEWIFEASCDHKPDLEKFNKIANEILGGKVSFSAQKLDPKIDWVSKSLKDLKPVIAGGFYIRGNHDKSKIPSNLIELKINAAQAFGTGHHETTTGCLEAIKEILENKKPNAMLDIGTGTGVLAIALAKLTKQKIIASDIDQIAVKTTKDNAKLNKVAKIIHAIKATGAKHKDITKNAPYDLIVANILAKPLEELAPEIKKIAAKNATIILSGILTKQAANVIAAYEKQDIKLKKQLTKGEWATLTLEKS